MPLPLIALALLLGTPAGVVATKTTTRIRHWMNEGEIIKVHCPRCEDSGPHEFSRIDRGWTASILTGAATGAIGGTVSGIVAKRVFKCKSCGADMYQDGKRPTRNADKAMHSLITKITPDIKGKKLAVLGEQGVGKTCLISFLSTGSRPEKYEPDLYAKNVPGRRFKLRDLKLKILPLKHLPGSADEYSEWKDVANEADIVLYLLRVDQLMTGHEPTEDRVRKDMGQIKKWLKAKSKDSPLFLIGTHCDRTDPDFTTLSPVERSNYKNKVREMSIFRKIVLLGGGKSKVRFVSGSLKSLTTTEQLVYDLFVEIEEKKKG